MKESIVYVSNEWYVDTDITVLADLANKYTIHWLYSTNYSFPRFNIQELERYALNNGIVLHLYDFHSKRLSWNSFKLQFGFIQAIREIQPKLVVRVSFHLYWVFLSFLLKRYRIVYAFHDVLSHSNSGLLGILNDICRNIIVNTNRYFIMYSTTQYEYFNKKWPGRIVKNVGMSIKSFGLSHKIRPDFSEGVKLLFFGRIESYKGLDLLIEAMELAYEKGISNIQLSIYGRGPFWEYCERLIKYQELFNTNIRFIDNSELADIFATHHFLVLPYRDATQSGPLMYAVNYELPLFASKLDGFLQVYPLDNGVYYEKDGLLDALEKVSRMTNVEYEGLKRRVRDLKSQFSSEAIAANYRDFFESII